MEGEGLPTPTSSDFTTKSKILLIPETDLGSPLPFVMAPILMPLRVYLDAFRPLFVSKIVCVRCIPGDAGGEGGSAYLLLMPSRQASASSAIHLPQASCLPSLQTSNASLANL